MPSVCDMVRQGSSDGQCTGPLNALAFTRGARTKRSATESKHEGRFTQAGAVGVQRLVGPFRSGLMRTFEYLILAIASVCSTRGVLAQVDRLYIGTIPRGGEIFPTGSGRATLRP